MSLPRAVAQGLAVLSEGLVDPASDLQAMLGRLTDGLTAAVPSYLGLTFTMQVDDDVVAVTTANAGRARSSLLLPLSSLVPTLSGSLILYAADSGAFIDLADDARWIFNLDNHAVLDSQLPAQLAGPAAASTHGLAEFSDINQAVGVLLEEGRTPPQAHTELRRRALVSHRALPETARELLDNLVRER
jgi:hypothetical protein